LLLAVQAVSVLGAGCDRADPRFEKHSDRQVLDVYIGGVLGNEAAASDAAIRELYRRGKRTLPTLDEVSNEISSMIKEGELDARRTAALLGIGSPEVDDADRRVSRLRQVALNLLLHKKAIAAGQKEPKVAVLQLRG